MNSVESNYYNNFEIVYTPRSMKREELKLIVTISVCLAIILGLGYLILSEKPINAVNGFRALSFGLSSTTIFWAFYLSFGWKLWGLRKIFYRPNLNGTWHGTLVSDWEDKKGKTVGDREFYIVIRQSFLRIHFTTFTDSFIGTSYSETFALKKETGLKNVSYLYRKETSQNDDKILQEGATELRFIESEQKKLEGKYWSNNKTNGKIAVNFISKKHVDSFKDASNL